MKALKLVFGCIGLATSAVTAQTPRDSVRLKEIVVTATRSTTRPREVGSATEVITAEEREKRQITTLEQALRTLPGTAVVTSGAPGGVTSTFFRGVNSNQTLILIDGIRVNDANLSPASILGGLEFGADDRLEVVRGPQSTLYGGAAIGGVISLFTAPASGPARWSAATEGGSFSTYRGRVDGSAATGPLGVSGSASFIDTKNQRVNNDYDQRSQQFRLDYRWSSSWSSGATFRGMQQKYLSPGDIRDPNTTPEVDSKFENNLGTVFTEGHPTRSWSARITSGFQEYFIRGASQYNGGDPFISKLRATRWVLDWQNRFSLGPSVELLAGANAEWSTVHDGDDSRDERLKAAYSELRVGLGEALSFAAGLRGDDYSSFGQAVTGRVTASYFIARSLTKFRASAGTGFLPPSLAARYGGPYQAANPSIKAEHSAGFDAGVDQFFAQGKGIVAVTVFRNSLRDLIGFESAPYPDLGRNINIAKARTSGVEVSSRVEAGRFDARVGYTYLAATDESATDPTLARLIRRPRHSVSADLAARAGRLRLGTGAVYSGGRQDTDFNAFPSVRVDLANYADVRLYASYQTTRWLTVSARAENLFDNRYEAIYGFPALGRRFMVSLQVAP